MDITLHLQ